jgi:hypothetical protein
LSVIRLRRGIGLVKVFLRLLLEFIQATGTTKIVLLA